MRLVRLSYYGRHDAWRNSVQGSPAVHAMRKTQTIVVDANAFLYAGIYYSDAVYPDEPERRNDPMLEVVFSKGGDRCSVKTPASDFKRIMKTDPPEICR